MAADASAAQTSAYATAQPSTKAVSVECRIEGKVLPIDSFKAVTGAYGSVGHCTFTTSRTELNKSGINLVSDTSAAAEPLPIVIQVGMESGAAVQVFSGQFDDAKWDYLTDTVTIHGRDLAGALVDAKFVLTKGYAAKTPSQLVTEIAKKYGFTPVVTPVPNGPGGTPQTIGALLGVQGSYMSYPRPTWDLLQALARAVGYLLWVTPQKQMFFAPPDADATPTIFSWNIVPTPSAIPLMNLMPSYAPRRNKNFSVVVLSHHGQTTQLVQSTVVVLGETLSIPDVKTIKAGTYTGAAGTRVRGLASSALNGQPTYVFRQEGLTAQQAQTKAEAIAADIAKHSFKIDATCSGLPSLAILQAVQVQGQVDDFLGKKLFVNSIDQNFRMPHQSERGPVGFWTSFKALSIPPTSINDPSEVE